jgi:hypothetical protein
MRLLADGKLEEARFILEDLAFRSLKEPNVLYNLGMVYSEFHKLDIAIDTLKRYVNIVPLYSNALYCPRGWHMDGRVLICSHYHLPLLILVNGITSPLLQGVSTLLLNL